MKKYVPNKSAQLTHWRYASAFNWFPVTVKVFQTNYVKSTLKQVTASDFTISIIILPLLSQHYIIPIIDKLLISNI
jgi:hypothetical protein